jgi:hypothetical protein
MPEEKKKKGFMSMIKDSMNKSGGCCGAGETCGGTAPAAEPEKSGGKKKSVPK